MEQSFNTINLEYQETNKTSRFSKIVAGLLIAIFTFAPMYEFIPKLEHIVVTQCTYGIVGTCGCMIGGL